MPSTDFITRYRGRVAQLNHAYASGDAAAFDAALDAMNEDRNAVHDTARDSAVMTGVMKLSDDLAQALWRFRADPPIDAIIEFAGLGAVIDDPISTWSDGMRAGSF